jgi:hypothetical protein
MRLSADERNASVPAARFAILKPFDCWHRADPFPLLAHTAVMFNSK